MKKRNQFIKRIGAILCALVVVVSCFGVVPCKAEITFDYELPDVVYDYKYFTLVEWKVGELRLIVSDNILSYYDSDGYRAFGGDTTSTLDWRSFWTKDGITWKEGINGSTNRGFVIMETNPWVVYYENMEVSLLSNYNPSLGYLQNVKRKTTYIRDAFYNYYDDTKTVHWNFDLLTNTNIDLSSGNYVIRHYVSMATVNGYEKEDIVRMSDKYFMGEYGADSGSFSYLDLDYEKKLEEYGYEYCNWFESIFKGYFTLQHHYLQIVDVSTNECGGYLHLYPHDSDPDSFGVELEYEGLDDEFEVDPNAPNGNVKPSTGSGETLDDALENADAPKLDDLQGVDLFVEDLEAYAMQVENVVSGLAAFLGLFPPWLVGLVGLGIALTFVVVVVKAIRG